MRLSQIISTICASGVLGVAVAAGAGGPETPTTQPRQVIPLWTDSVPRSAGDRSGQRHPHAFALPRLQ